MMIALRLSARTGPSWEATLCSVTSASCAVTIPTIRAAGRACSPWALVTAMVPLAAGASAGGIGAWKVGAAVVSTGDPRCDDFEVSPRRASSATR
jgi:hypothetical protein